MDANLKGEHMPADWYQKSVNPNYVWETTQPKEISTTITGGYYKLPKNDNPFVELFEDGLLKIQAGYVWDGATCCPEYESIRRGSLFHDALYQLMRIGGLDSKKFRDDADQLLLECCQEDNMNSVLAATVYSAVRMFGGIFSHPKAD